MDSGKSTLRIVRSFRFAERRAQSGSSIDQFRAHVHASLTVCAPRDRASLRARIVNTSSRCKYLHSGLSLSSSFVYRSMPRKRDRERMGGGGGERGAIEPSAKVTQINSMSLFASKRR